MQKGFDSGPVYNEKHLKTKIKSYDGKINTNFHDSDVTKECFHCICLSVIFIDCVLKMGEIII